MQIIETEIEGLMVLEPRVFEDKRGYFYEAYRENLLAAEGLNYHFVQDNQSRSARGVIRGLHLQLPPHAQTKLIRVTEGCILDVAVDLREGSATFGKWVGVELSVENHRQLLIPKGFAHGFSVLSSHATILYKCDAYYNKEAEAGIRFDDPDLNIDWRVDPKKATISEKDMQLPALVSF